MKDVEKITRINGNGTPYTMPLPKVFILGALNDVARAHIKENTGLEFVEVAWGWEVQPETSAEIAALFLTYNFSSTYYNNADHKNLLFLRHNAADKLENLLRTYNAALSYHRICVAGIKTNPPEVQAKHEYAVDLIERFINQLTDILY